MEGFEVAAEILGAENGAFARDAGAGVGGVTTAGGFGWGLGGGGHEEHGQRHCKEEETGTRALLVDRGRAKRGSVSSQKP
ncbi:hypothetical protein GW17_00008427 [Ensete ventricosum]|nr:hypothetical protein GW17_00008427 [Ensete ventricosum]